MKRFLVILLVIGVLFFVGYTFYSTYAQLKDLSVQEQKSFLELTEVHHHRLIEAENLYALMKSAKTYENSNFVEILRAMSKAKTLSTIEEANRNLKIGLMELREEVQRDEVLKDNGGIQEKFHTIFRVGEFLDKKGKEYNAIAYELNLLTAKIPGKWIARYYNIKAYTYFFYHEEVL